MSKIPHYKQLDAMDCGPSCLRMISKFYGKTYSLQSLRSKSFISREGVSMLGISDAAENIGFRTRGYRLTWEQLRDEVPLPCIIHWNQRHFVVVYGIKKRRRIFGWGSEHRAQGSGHRVKNILFLLLIRLLGFLNTPNPNSLNAGTAPKTMALKRVQRFY